MEPATLDRIAKFQSWLIWLVLAGLTTNVAMTIFGKLALIPGLLVVSLQIFLLWILSRELQINATWRLVIIPLLFLPIVSIVVVLVINGMATRTLRRHGIKVGLMGAKSEPRRGSLPPSQSQPPAPASEPHS